MFHQKLGSQNACGLLLHLPRFYVERRPKALTLIEQVVNYLKAQPNCSAELNKIREDLDMGATLKKLSKTFNFQKFVKSEVVSVQKKCCLICLKPDYCFNLKLTNAQKSKKILTIHLYDSKT